ncbi:ComEC/Rec2 family competence protein [Reichenbachiella sp. MSK19-1]|uniref:ComEC/Rec2 family competence protein n=1 Tax=Reichenbachiella sp. MSK19-1 TaxID=1897631 RepID=UPI000E6D0F80|nr:ComEC/Rec2 family competence protein [Reichenbachiella sp. MSK19-1]
MFAWSHLPFVRITVVFILGILLSTQLPQSWGFSYHVLLITIAFMVTSIFFLFEKKYLTTLTIGCILLGLVATLGSYRYLNYNQSHVQQSDDIFRQCQASTGVITSYPISKAKYDIYQVETQHIKTDSSIIAWQENIQLYVKKDTLNPSVFQYGDLITLQDSPFRISPPNNPHEFNYAEYMAIGKIYFQQFIATEDIILLKEHQANPLLGAVYRLRKHFENLILSAVPTPKEQGIALALLLGIKDQLDTDIKSAYAAVGAMHVLAVSGLHVGVIHFILLFFFRPIRSTTFKKYVLPVISITVLWAYALLTGFSPSILRAVTMFSLIILGQSMDRTVNIYNSISVSAFILLFFNPNQIFSVGFQLSYLAVIGIIYLYDKIYQLWSPRLWILDKVWSLTAVSIAAQVATAPISIYYFNQFPNYFLGSNLVVIPAAFAIMAEGLFMFLANSIYLTVWPGFILSHTIMWLNWVVDFIYLLPGSLKNWLFLSSTQTILTYLAILFAIAFFELKKMRFAWLIMSCILLIACEGSWRIYQQHHTQETLLYHTRKNRTIDHIDGLKTKLYALDSVSDHELLAYQINPNRLHKGLPELTDYTLISQPQNMIDSGIYAQIINDEKFIFLTEKFQSQKIRFKLETDYLVLEKNALSSLETVDKYFEFKEVILSNSNRRGLIRKLEKEAKQLNIAYRSMLDESYMLKK